MLRQEKEQLENVLSHKSIEVRKALQGEAQRQVNFGYDIRLIFFRVEDELKKNLSQQKGENVKLQGQIGTLKQEKTQL